MDVDAAPNPLVAELNARLKPRIRIEDTFDGVVGVEFEEATETRVRARVPDTRALRTVGGVVHGGAFAVLAESLASLGTALAAAELGHHAVGLSNQTMTLVPTTADALVAEARLVDAPAGGEERVWRIDITDDAGETCAVSTVIVAIRAPA